MVKLKSMIKELKFRWTHAPKWVKVVDTMCWVVLFLAILVAII